MQKLRLIIKTKNINNDHGHIWPSFLEKKMVTKKYLFREKVNQNQSYINYDKK